MIKKFFSKETRRIMKLEYEVIKNYFNGHKPFKKMEKEISKQYYTIHHKKINWSNPVSYSEKLNVSKIYNYNTIKTRLTDKLLVRDWIKEKIGEAYLIPLIGVYDRFEEINFDDLPESFVIKCNHDSGSVTICKNKNDLNLKRLGKLYSLYLKRNFAYTNYEMHYKDIKPKILIEKNMGDNINDYKFLCFNGEPYYCWVDTNRFLNHKRNIYNMDWNLMPFNQMNYGNNKAEIKRPKTFNEMKKIVKLLCKGFDHVRVDLYEIDNRIYFGEMTFTNGNGMEIISPHDYDIKLGNLWSEFISNRK